MDTKHPVGRNDPCPCGSGKKYKKCHGALSENYPAIEREAKYQRLSKEIAYKGKIGRMREDFCVKYIKHKQDVIKDIEKTQIEMAKSRGETITCHKGCGFCCVQYVDASIQEAEAIVYHLYKNESILNTFLQVYPEWRERVRSCGDSFNRIVHQWEKTGDSKWRDRKSVDGGLAALYEYTVANIPCPFLQNSACAIYEVRPYNCAGAFATTPAELCKPLNRSRAKIYTSLQSDILDDSSFYFHDLAHPVQSFMPLMVYQLLAYGLIGMPEIPGLSNLPSELINDPEVKPILQKYL